MKHKQGLALILAGIVLFLAAGGLAAYNYREDLAARRQSEAVLGEVAEAITRKAAENAASPVRPGKQLGKQYDAQSGTADAAQNGAQQSFAEAVTEMSTVNSKGDSYIGILEIPALGITLPVLADWNYQLLKQSPCYYAGSYYTDDLVICAHNYRSHFNGLRHIDMGADVYFTAADGTVYHYVTVNRETLQPDENDRMIDPDGDWDLTLFTCYIGGATRCAVRCQLVRDAADL